MGLGKTIQMISLLILIQKTSQQSSDVSKPHLLVLPTSLIGNWKAEIQKFAPQLSFFLAHSSNAVNSVNAVKLTNIDLVITTYGSLHRFPWLIEQDWNLVILDEAQAIKNSTAKQTSTAKSIKSRVRFVLTGTPVENRILDLWSLFDFIAPGLLGSSKEFAKYGNKKKSEELENNNDNIEKENEKWIQSRNVNFIASVGKLVAILCKFFAGSQ